MDDTQLYDDEVAGTLRHVRVGLDAVRRPRPDAVVLHVRPGHHRRPASAGYNDANWCSEEYDALYGQQKVELDPSARREIVPRCCGSSTANRPISCCSRTPTSQAYRTDRFEGWLQQPAETGPVLFTNTSPTYVNLSVIGAERRGQRRPRSRARHGGPATSDAGPPEATTPTTAAAPPPMRNRGRPRGRRRFEHRLIVGIIVAAQLCRIGAWAMKRKSSADDRE